MARGSKSSKLAAAKAGGSKVNSEIKPKVQISSKISDELRKAVKDLGGDDEDLALIDGVDSDDEAVGKSTVPTQAVDEKLLKKELGAFMKGLDFSVAQVDEISTDEEEEEDDEESEAQSADEDNEDEEEEEDESEDAEEEEDNEEEEEEEEEEPVPQPAKADKKASAIENSEVTKTKNDKQGDNGSASNVPAAQQWETLAPSLPALTSPPASLTHFQLNGLRQKATRLLEELPPLSKSSSSSDTAFINQILQSGTHQDKLSALILIVRESPVHSMKELNRLRAMTGWKDDGSVSTGSGGNKDQRIAVMKALADWWVAGGGKERGKLKYFADQPLLAHPQLTDRHLLLFAFEDYLKKWFFNFLQVLETLSHDTLPFIRTQALHIIFRCLSGNAEQEQNLLRLGVNKLGDTDKPVASKASHHLLQLLQAHPAMKAIIAREVASLVLKPSAPTPAASSGSHMRFEDDKSNKKASAAPLKPETTGHGRYYGLITLNQVTLTRKDQDVAGKLVELYFEVFREILGDMAKDDEHKDTNAIEGEGAEEKIEKAVGKVDKWRGRRKGTRTKSGRKSALEEEESLIDSNEAKLVAAVLTGINRALPYASLDEEIFSNYMNTLFKITHAGTFNTSIQALNLIFQVSKSRQSVSDRFYRTLYDSLFDGRLITSSKQAMYLNLLFKAMKVDSNTSRVMAFVKRLLQMLGMHQPSFICGALYLLGELFNSTPGLKRMLIEPEDDGEEHFVDADADAAGRQSNVEISKNASHSKEYDGRKREPQYANADSSCLWELTPFLNHFHPSVSLQANQLLLSQSLTGSSDISLNTLVSFLDRFVYRNPKKTLQPKGASIMQPAAASDSSGMLVNNRGAKSGGGNGEVNSEAFWRKKIEDVPVEMMFFHRYFSEKLARKERMGGDKKKGKVDEDEEDEDEVVDIDDDGEEVQEDDEAEEVSEDEGVSSAGGEDEELPSEDDDSDAEEAEIWKAMKSSMPRAGDAMGMSEDEDDDFSEDDDESESESESEAEVAPKDTKTKTSQSKGKGKGKAASSSEDEDEDEDEEMSDDDFPSFDEDDDDLLPEEDIVLEAKSDSEEEEDDEEEGKKRKRREDRKEKRKKRKEMPTFADADEYAKLIDADGSEDE